MCVCERERERTMNVLDTCKQNSCVLNNISDVGTSVELEGQRRARQQSISTDR